MKRLKLFWRYLTGNWWDVVPHGALGWYIQHRRTRQYLFDHCRFDRKSALMAASLRNHGY